MWHAFCFYMYMMKMQITIKYGWRLACLLLFGSVVGAGAQESWSVDSCMRYALERNLALKNSRLDTRYRSRRLYGGDRRFPAFGQYQRGFRETDGTFG